MENTLHVDPSSLLRLVFFKVLVVRIVTPCLVSASTRARGVLASEFMDAFNMVMVYFYKHKPTVNPTDQTSELSSYILHKSEKFLMI